MEPLILPAEAYIQNWKSVQYNGKLIQSNAISFTTDRGEAVRSKSEKILADKFYKLDIPYRYEYPMELQGFGVIYPDFTILNTRTREEYYWEHLGMMGDANYCDKAIKKINTYIENNIFPGERLILSYEINNYINLNAIDTLIQRYLL